MRQLKERLEKAALHERTFQADTYEIAEELESEGAELDAVRTILKFMESHPDLDFGAPGPLCSFAETFAGRGYEVELVESLRRRPTPHTVTMLGGVIGGAEPGPTRESYLAELRAAARHPQADDNLRAVVEFFLA